MYNMNYQICKFDSSTKEKAKHFLESG